MRKGCEIARRIPHHLTLSPSPSLLPQCVGLGAEKNSILNELEIFISWLAGIAHGMICQQWVACCSKLLPLRTTSVPPVAPPSPPCLVALPCWDPGHPLVPGMSLMYAPTHPLIASLCDGNGCYPLCFQGPLEILTHPDITATPSAPPQQGRVGPPSVCNLPGEHQKQAN